jgi:ubiquinone/menaquinone biosynthesis C-methylase UbiE
VRTPEKLDEPSLPFEEAERSLGDLGRINRLLLGALPLKRTLLPRLGRWTGPRPVLDLGTGTGEIAADLARAAARRGAPLKVVGVDLKLRHLVIGRRRAPGQLRVVADATALPFRDGAVEWSFSTLFFHHFEAGQNRQVLAEMRRVSRAGAVVVDLRPSRLALRLLLVFFRLIGASEVTRHDGRVSFERSWSLADVARLTESLPVRELRRRFPFRWSLVIDGGRTWRPDLKSGGRASSETRPDGFSCQGTQSVRYSPAGGGAGSSTGSAGSTSGMERRWRMGRTPNSTSFSL